MVFDASIRPYGLDAADLPLVAGQYDGYPDLVLAIATRDMTNYVHGGTTGVSVYRNHATWSTPSQDDMSLFQIVPLSNVNASAAEVEIADMDQDGFGDVVTANQPTDVEQIGSFSVLINKMIIFGGQ